MSCFIPLLLWQAPPTSLPLLAPAALGVRPSYHFHQSLPPRRYFPPVLLQPDVPGRSPCHHPFGDKRSCQVIDPASQHSRLCCQIPLVNLSRYPRSPPGSFCFLGASYGHLIFSRNRSCLVVDAFTGVNFSPPQIPGDESTEVYYGALTTPLASPNPHLLVTNGSHNYFWRVGSHSWLRACPCDGMVKQIVTFKGQVFGMDSVGMLFVMHLVPRNHVRMMGVSWGGISTRHLANLYLVYTHRERARKTYTYTRAHTQPNQTKLRRESLRLGTNMNGPLSFVVLER